MSVDVYMKPDDPERKFTKDELIKRLEKGFRVLDVYVGGDGFVTGFGVEPLQMPNSEKIVFEFNRQDDGRWWHPVDTRSDEGIELDGKVVSNICFELAMEEDFSDLV